MHTEEKAPSQACKMETIESMVEAMEAREAREAMVTSDRLLKELDVMDWIAPAEEAFCNVDASEFAAESDEECESPREKWNKPLLSTLR